MAHAATADMKSGCAPRIVPGSTTGSASMKGNVQQVRYRKGETAVNVVSRKEPVTRHVSGVLGYVPTRLVYVYRARKSKETPVATVVSKSAPAILPANGTRGHV